MRRAKLLGRHQIENEYKKQPLIVVGQLVVQLSVVPSELWHCGWRISSLLRGLKSADPVRRFEGGHLQLSQDAIHHASQVGYSCRRGRSSMAHLVRDGLSSLTVLPHS
ncbi:hypothetical protein MES5069_220179 [Mesorhizobium escarrei]|uniref:Transposase n=1 Tax=Mesorhizobium escarrei TaxID=666018 RepID=A0ABM9DTI3_9HYPH|nr:hypothetical protein MES5069_220179 [Mesorhizobium escarrei]